MTPTAFKTQFGEWRKGWRVLGWTLTALGVIGGITGAILWLCVTVSSMQCRNTGHDMGRESRFSISTGCLLRDDLGRWVPKDNLRIIVRGEP